MNTTQVTEDFIRKIIRAVPPTAHKGTQGHALLIGGSYGKMGAVCLASKAALHSGAGLVTAFIPECGYEILQVAIPEVMVITDANLKTISSIHYDFMPSAIGIGPGMGQESETQVALHEFLSANKTPLVVDADALNILSNNTGWLTLLPQKTILTPHQKELERLIGVWKTEAEKMAKVETFSSEHNVVIVMKGAPTNIIYKNDRYENTTGNQALATAGSGDVLTGIITGLLAQGYEPLHAAIAGVYLHGLTADLALPETGYQAFTASDIIRYLGKAYLNLG